MQVDYAEQYAWLPAMFSGYKAWVLRAYGLKLPDPEAVAEQPGLVLIVTRTAGHSRQMQGSAGLAEHARARGWRVRMMDISTLSIREQIEMFMTASIFICVHGAATTLAAFLPVRAVAVELMPHGFGSGAAEHLDCYHCFTNWLDIASVSHVVWHDPHLQKAPGSSDADRASICGKQAHVVLDDAAVREVFSAAEQLWHTHPIDRGNKGKVIYLNEPKVC